MARPLLGSNPNGNETGHVAAIVLARRAWRYAQEVNDALESYARMARDAERRAVAADEVRAFREREIATWFDQVWAVMSSRPDGDVLALALAVENVAQRAFVSDGRSPSEVARLAADELENRTAAVWRPRITALPPLIDKGDLGRSLGTLPRWLAFARIAIDDAGDTVEGAAIAWARLAEVVTEKLGDSDVILGGVQHVSQYTWVTAGCVLAMQPDPAASFTALFAKLWLEREQAYMGVRRPVHGSDLPINAATSRFVLGIAARALTVLPEMTSFGAGRALWAPLFDGLREMWLRGADNVGRDRWVIHWVFACGGAAHRVAVTGDPQATGLRAELEDALAFVEPDPSLVILVASSWLANGWPVAEALDLFGRAHINLRAVCASLAAEPDEWRGDHREDLNGVRNAIELDDSRNSGALGTGE